MKNIRKKIGIVCCSNGLKSSYKKRLHLLEETLKDIGLVPVFSEFIYEETAVFSAPAKKRADALMRFYQDDEITDIYDISGGDLANGILPYLDYKLIEKSDKCFYGYSDLTTVLNAIYAKTGKVSGLYQIRNILSEFREQQMKDIGNLYECMNDEKEKASLFQFDYQFVQGQSMEGVVIGGNIRCFLKLAGTPYIPDFQDKILFLESRSGLLPQMETFLCHLQQLGAFDKIAGILLGTFTQLDKEREYYLKEHVDLEKMQCFDRCSEQLSLKDKRYPSMAELLQNYVREDLPIAVTKQIGHGQDAKAIQIGAYYNICNSQCQSKRLE